MPPHPSLPRGLGQPRPIAEIARELLPRRSGSPTATTQGQGAVGALACPPRPADCNLVVVSVCPRPTPGRRRQTTMTIGWGSAERGSAPGP